MTFSADWPTREKQILIACARTRLSAPVAAKIRELAASPLDWQLLLQTASEHSILPLLARNLSSAAPDLLSAERLATLRESARTSSARSLQLAAELIRIMDLFGAKGILAMPYKGPVLAAQAYGDIALRQFEDLDVLLPQRDMPAASDILSAAGYKPRFPWIFSREAAIALVPGEYNFFHEARGIIVELHTERTLRHFPVPPDFDEMARHLVPVALSGHEIATFCPADMLVLLCIHGSKDFWERICWVADISEFVQSQPALDWDAVFACAAKLKAQRMLFLGLELAARLLDAPLPPKVLAMIRADAVVPRRAAELERRLLSSGTSPRTAAASFHYRRDMVPGTLAGWRYALRLAAVPAEEDWLMVKLPPVLAPLYFALRPLRLLRKHGAGGK